MSRTAIVAMCLAAALSAAVSGQAFADDSPLIMASVRSLLADVLPPGTFLAFLQRRGKIGGQHKMPRVLDDAQLRELTARPGAAT